ncbi:unnamed protein product [Caenorhabditis brenneri]
MSEDQDFKDGLFKKMRMTTENCVIEIFVLLNGTKNEYEPQQLPSQCYHHLHRREEEKEDPYIEEDQAKENEKKKMVACELEQWKRFIFIGFYSKKKLLFICETRISMTHVIRRVDSDADNTVDEESDHNRLLREVFEEPMSKGELSGSSRQALFPQEENDDEPETQTLDEEEPTTSEAYELDGPLPTLPEPNQQTEQIVASLEDGAPLPPDQEARFLLLLQDPKTPPNLMPVLNGVMKIHNDFVVFLF